MQITALVLSASLVLQLLPLAGRSTIRGRVFDADGRPMPDVEMRALLIAAATTPVGEIVRSDAEGRFTISRIPAGRIILRAQPQPPRRVRADQDFTRVRAHPPAFYPGVLTLPDAWPIEVGPEEIIELDFHMPPVVIGSIKTMVTGPDGYVLDELRVIRPEANQIKNVTIDADGIGYADGLREGRYTVYARARAKDVRLAAFQIVEITPGELPVNLALVPAAKLTGRIVADRGGVPPIGNMRVMAAWTDGSIDLDPLSSDQAGVAPDGSFTIDGLFGSRAVRVSGLADGWQVASIRHGRSDVTTSTINLAAGTTTELIVALTRR